MAQNRVAIRQEITNNRTELGQTIHQLASFDLKAQAQNKFQEVKPVVVARVRERAETLLPEARDKYVELKPVVAERAKEKWEQLKPVVAEQAKEKGGRAKSLVTAKASEKLGPMQESIGPLIQVLQQVDYGEVLATVKEQASQLAVKARAALSARLGPAVSARLDQLSRRSSLPALKRGLPALKRGG